MNKFIGMGRLTADPEIRYSQGSNNTVIANFSIAIDRKFKREGEPDADFFRCTAFGKTAEFTEKYLRKGIKIVVDGHLQNDTYTNKDGQKVTTMKIMIDALEFAESKSASQQNSGNYGSDKVNGQGYTGGHPAGPAPEGFMEIPSLGEEGALPFT